MDSFSDTSRACRKLIRFLRMRRQAVLDYAGTPSNQRLLAIRCAVANWKQFFLIFPPEMVGRHSVFDIAIIVETSRSWWCAGSERRHADLISNRLRRSERCGPALASYLR